MTRAASGLPSRAPDFYALGKCQRPMAELRLAGYEKQLAGENALAPPSALAGRGPRPFPNVTPCAASGWMQIRARAKQRVDLPLLISAHRLSDG